MVREGFIVHPNWTGNSKFHASYGPNYNRTVKSFNTLEQAKAYLRKNNVTGKTIYQTSSGNSQTVTLSPRRTPVKRKSQTVQGLGMSGFGLPFRF